MGGGVDYRAPADIVRFLAAVQAQDYRGALWAVGLRISGATEESIEQALAGRAIVRTWSMRGTLHLVTAEDVRWMLALLAPRNLARSAGRERQLGLAAREFERCRTLLERALRGGGRLTRRDIYARLEDGGVSTSGQRGIHILARLAQEGVICHGPRAGAQDTFVLLDEWVSAGKPRPRDEALADLALRYFTSHGPATLKDFAWWAGLPLADARRGLAGALPSLAVDDEDGQSVWGPPGRQPSREKRTIARLLPPFDELLVAYRDRSAALDPIHAGKLKTLLSPTIAIGDRIIGTWTRRTAKSGVTIIPRYFGAPTQSELRAIQSAMRRYREFLGSAPFVDNEGH
jgi:hypothetical protein